MLARLDVQVLDEQRRAADELLHVGVLAVEHAQRIAGEAPPAVGIELRLVGAQILEQPRPILTPALGCAEGIELELQPADA